MDTMFMQNFGGQTKSNMVFLKVAHITCGGVSLLNDGGEPKVNDLLAGITSVLKLFLGGLKESESA